MAVRTSSTPASVKDIMTRDPVCVSPDTSAVELARILEANEISGVPVVDALDRAIGVVSKTDLLPPDMLDEWMAEDRAGFPEDVEVLPVSAVAHRGLDVLKELRQERQEEHVRP